MIKKYLWHFIFALFILISLAHIFQKLKWSAASKRDKVQEVMERNRAFLATQAAN